MGPATMISKPISSGAACTCSSSDWLLALSTGTPRLSKTFDQMTSVAMKAMNPISR